MLRMVGVTVSKPLSGHSLLQLLEPLNSKTEVRRSLQTAKRSFTFATSKCVKREATQTMSPNR